MALRPDLALGTTAFSLLPTSTFVLLVGIDILCVMRLHADSLLVAQLDTVGGQDK
jgi:hypothetical protein